MTKLNNYFLKFLAIGSMVFLYSCGEDDPMPTSNPTISITAGDFDDTNNTATGVAGDVVTASLTVSAEGGFNTLRITKSGGEPFDEVVETKVSGEAGPATFSTTFSYTLVEAEVGETVTFTVQAVDDTDDANPGSITLTVVTEEPASPDARLYTEILLAPPLGNKSAKTFFSTDMGERYTPGEAVASSEPLSAYIDFGYFEGSATGANLASPLSFDTNSNRGISAQTDSWGTLNDITFRTTTLTSAEFFEVVTFADIDAAFEGGTAPTDPANVGALAVDDVIAFQTDADKPDGAKKGLLQVISITPGTGTGGSIELEIIVQEEAI